MSVIVVSIQDLRDAVSFNAGDLGEFHAQLTAVANSHTVGMPPSNAEVLIYRDAGGSNMWYPNGDEKVPDRVRVLVFGEFKSVSKNHEFARVIKTFLRTKCDVDSIVLHAELQCAPLPLEAAR